MVNRQNVNGQNANQRKCQPEFLAMIFLQKRRAFAANSILFLFKSPLRD